VQVSDSFLVKRNIERCISDENVFLGLGELLHEVFLLVVKGSAHLVGGGKTADVYLGKELFGASRSLMLRVQNTFLFVGLLNRLYRDLPASGIYTTDFNDILFTLGNVLKVHAVLSLVVSHYYVVRSGGHEVRVFACGVLFGLAFRLHTFDLVQAGAFAGVPSL